MGVRVVFASVLVAAVIAPSASAARFAVTVTGTVLTMWREHVTFVQNGCTFTTDDVGGSSSLAFEGKRGAVVSVTRSRGFRLGGASFGTLTGTVWTPIASGTAVSQDCGQAIHWDGVPSGHPFTGRVGLTRPRRGQLAFSYANEPDPAFWGPPELGTAAVPPLDRAIGRVAERRFFDKRVKRIVVRAQYNDDVPIVGDITGSLMRDIQWKVTFRRLGR